MTVKEFIKILKRFPKTATVTCVDATSITLTDASGIPMRVYFAPEHFLNTDGGNNDRSEKD